MTNLNNFRFKLGTRELVPIVLGGMGVDISSATLALEVARLGGVGHISDAMVPYVSDKHYDTSYQNAKQKQFDAFKNQENKAGVIWDFDVVRRAAATHSARTMEAKRGPGAIHVNVMEKLTMGEPCQTLRARLLGAMDGGIDGITLSAGLHTSSLKLMEDHPRFRDVKVGVIVSSARALRIFLRSADRVKRAPDYVVVEGPLAGGHLGFGLDWKEYDLKSITQEVITFLQEAGLDIPVIAAGGVFTGSEAVDFLQLGAAAVQVATRFTISQECGLPTDVKQKYLEAQEEDVIVSMISPAGYPMRMLTSSPCLTSNIKPNCEALGYLLDGHGNCAYHKAYRETGLDASGKKLPVTDKMCICYHFMTYKCYTCGHNVYRLKDTTLKGVDGRYKLPSAEHIFNDYLYSTDYKIKLPDTAV